MNAIEPAVVTVALCRCGHAQGRHSNVSGCRSLDCWCAGFVHAGSVSVETQIYDPVPAPPVRAVYAPVSAYRNPLRPRPRPERPVREPARRVTSQAPAAVMADPSLGYSAPEVCRLTGVSYRQLDYWTTSGWLTDQRNPGSGVPRVYVDHDLDVIFTAVALIEVGFGAAGALRVAYQLVEAGAPLRLGIVTVWPLASSERTKR